MSAIYIRYMTRKLNFADVHEGILRMALWLNAGGRTAITGLSCVGVYEVDHYWGFMVYIRATSPRHVRCSKLFVVFCCYTDIDYGARGSVACYPILCSPDCTYRGNECLSSIDRTFAASALDALASVYALARHCCSVAVSWRLKFTWIVTNEYPFVDWQNPCTNSCCLLP